MTTKTRIQQLEKARGKVKPVTWREFIDIESDVEWQRSMETLADALGGTRAELDEAMQELFGDKPTAKP